jgi:hypothetical protein
LYGQSQLQTIQKAERGELDVIVIGAGSKMEDRLWNLVRRVVVDEAHQVFKPGCKMNGGVMKHVIDWSNQYSSRIRHKWLLTGTPWIDFHADKQVGRYFWFLSSPSSNTGSSYLSSYYNRQRLRIEQPAHLRALVMRHTMGQQVRHEDGSVKSALPVPDLNHRQIMVDLSKEEKRLYEIATCLDHIARSRHYFSRDSLPEIFRYRLMIANGALNEFCESVRSYYNSHWLPNVEAHAWIDGVHNLLAEIHQLCTFTRQMSKFKNILRDMEENLQKDENFKAVIVTEDPHTIGSWLDTFSDLSIVVGDNCKGTIKTKTQRAIETFQTGDYRVFVCPIHVAEVGVNLQMAKVIYFVDPDFDRTRYDQAVGRIRRAGVKHSQLDAVMVVVKDTIHEIIFKFHLQEDKSDLNLFRQVDDHEHDYESMPVVTLDWNLCPHPRIFDKTAWMASEVFIAHGSTLEITRVNKPKLKDGEFDDLFQSLGVPSKDMDELLNPSKYILTLTTPKIYSIDRYDSIVVDTHAYGQFKFRVGLQTETAQNLIFKDTRHLSHSLLLDGETRDVTISRMLGCANEQNCEIVQQCVFLELHMKQCKCCMHRTLDVEKFKTTIFGPNPFWHKLMPSLKRNRLEIEIDRDAMRSINGIEYHHTSPNENPPNGTLLEYRNKSTQDKLVYYDASRQPFDRLCLSHEKMFYEKVCGVSYASIAIKLPVSTISIGTRVVYQVFDEMFETRVGTDKKTTDGIFHKRI